MAGPGLAGGGDHMQRRPAIVETIGGAPHIGGSTPIASIRNRHIADLVDKVPSWRRRGRGSFLDRIRWRRLRAKLARLNAACRLGSSVARRRPAQAGLDVRPDAMIVLIDNYDSFTFNLFHYLGTLGAHVAVHRNDRLGVSDVMSADPDAIVLSPGPCTPDEAGICLTLIETASPTIPIFGVCLGHQAIGQAFGGKVVRAPEPVHGKLSEIRHHGAGVFRGINGPFLATRYHSLVVERTTMPDLLSVTAETDDHLVMGLRHASLPVHGVQFHPESIASEHGHLILKNFLDIADAWNAKTGRRPAAVQAAQ